MPYTYLEQQRTIERVMLDKCGDSILCYPCDVNEDYRLCDTATNCWLGMIETYDGEEVLNLEKWAVQDFRAAFTFAQLMVKQHNMMRYGVSLNDFDMLQVTEE